MRSKETESDSDTPLLPVSSFYKLLDYRIYLRTKTRLVALCAVSSDRGNELKLYEWEWRGEVKGWKVGLANLKVEQLNLLRIAKDAQELAQKHAIPLKWDLSITDKE